MRKGNRHRVLINNQVLLSLRVDVRARTAQKFTQETRSREIALEKEKSTKSNIREDFNNGTLIFCAAPASKTAHTHRSHLRFHFAVLINMRYLWFSPSLRTRTPNTTMTGGSSQRGGGGGEQLHSTFMHSECRTTKCAPNRQTLLNAINPLRSRLLWANGCVTKSEPMYEPALLVISAVFPRMEQPRPKCKSSYMASERHLIVF